MTINKEHANFDQSTGWPWKYSQKFKLLLKAQNERDLISQ